MKSIFVAFSLCLVSIAAVAANGIAVERGRDSNVYGNCVPSLVVDNRSAETIAFLQVDVLLALRDGRERTIELKSAYREGAPAPIAPGATATLRQHLDTSRALGVPCGEVKDRSVARTICETVSGTTCASSLVVKP